MEKVIALFVASLISMSVFGQSKNERFNHFLPYGFIAKQTDRQLLRTESSTKQRMDSMVASKSKVLYIYNTSQRVIEELGYILDGSTWKNTSRLSYNDNGQRTSRFYTYKNGAGWYSHKMFMKYSNGLLVSDSAISKESEDSPWKGVSKNTYTYDKEGKLINSEYYSWNSSTEVWDKFSRQIYVYDGNGNQTEKLEHNWDRYYMQWATIAVYKTVSTYNNNGQILSATDFYWDSNNKALVHYYKTEYTYDALGGELIVTGYNWNDDQWVDAYKREYTRDANSKVLTYTYLTKSSGNWISGIKDAFSYDNNYTLNDLFLPYGFDNMFLNKMLGFVEYNYNMGEWVKSDEYQTYYSAQTTTAINDQVLPNSLNVYPNPASGYVTISNGSEDGTALLELHDIQGQLVFNKSVENNTPVSLIDVKSGLYVYSVTNEKSETKKGKLVVE